MIIEMQEKIRKLSASPAYRALVRRRRRITCLLTAVGILQFVVYFGAIAWLPTLSGTLWPQGGAVSLIIWLTVLVIVMSVLISAFYIWWTSRYFDPERDRILHSLRSSFRRSRPLHAAGRGPESSEAKGRPEGDTVFHRMPGQARDDRE